MTGAGRGIGRAIAWALADAGCDVAINARRREDLEETAAGVAERGRRALIDDADIRDHSEDLADRTVAELGGLDVWVSNVGGSDEKTVRELVDTPDEVFRSQLELNLTTAFQGAKAAAARMPLGERDHQHRLRRGDARVSPHRTVRGGQGGDAEPHRDPGAGAGAEGHPRQRRVARAGHHGGLHRGARRLGQAPGAARRPSRSDGWASPTTSPPPCSTWPRRPPAGSRARTSWSPGAARNAATSTNHGPSEQRGYRHARLRRQLRGCLHVLAERGPGAGAPGRADGVLLHVDHEGRRPGRRDHELRRRERPVLGDVHQASEAGGRGRGPSAGGHRHHQPRHGHRHQPGRHLQGRRPSSTTTRRRSPGSTPPSRRGCGPRAPIGRPRS